MSTTSTTDPDNAEPSSAAGSRSLTGRSAAPGVALAPAMVVTPGAAAAEEPPQGTPEEELARATEALDATEESLLSLSEKVAADAGADEAAIFEAHADFAADPELRSRVKKSTADGESASSAVRAAFDAFGQLLSASGDEYLAARAGDIDDVRDQVLARIRGEDPDAAGSPDVDEPVVVVARDLTPSQTARIPRAQLAAIACEEGSPTAHAAILARALGIPSVVGVTGLLAAVAEAEGAVIAVDGTAGEVIVGPTEAERSDLEERIAEERELAERLTELVDEPGQTSDGTRVELAANVNDEATLDTLAETGAEGSGLVRTEMLFLEATEPPTVDEQLAWYRRVLEAFPGQRVVVRTMDIGADKPVPYIELDEENPALGVRGLRLALARRELLVDQVTALVRAASQVGEGAGRLAIMFPMVSRPDELDAALAVVDEVCAAEGSARPEVGVMIEVPAAALAARRMAQRVDFLSLGTNDLMQYLFAADRVLAGVAHLPDVLDPDILRLIGDVVAAAHENDAWVGVCGEAAADPVQAAAFVGLGMDELSMTPSGIPRIKDTLRKLSREDLSAAVREAMDADGPESARQRITELVTASRRDAATG